MTTRQQEAPDLSLFDEELIGSVQDEDGPGLTVDDVASAEKVLRAIGKIEEQLEALEEERFDMIDEINEFYDKKEGQLRDSLEYLRGQIEQYVHDTGKTISVPSGQAYERERTSWEYADDDEIVEWCEQKYPHLVETEKSVNKNNLKRTIKDDWDETHGEDPPIAQRSHDYSVIISTS